MTLDDIHKAIQQWHVRSPYRPTIGLISPGNMYKLIREIRIEMPTIAVEDINTIRFGDTRFIIDSTIEDDSITLLTDLKR